MLVIYNICNINNFTNKSTYIELFYGIHRFGIDDTSNHMELIFLIGKYGAISTTYSTKTGYYVVNVISKTVTLQQYDTTYEQVFIEVDLALKLKYLITIQSNTNQYLEPEKHQQVIIVYTFIIWVISLVRGVISEIISLAPFQVSNLEYYIVDTMFTNR